MKKRSRKRRTGDPASVSVFRAEDRLFQSDGDWYYGTREGDRGPFATRVLAEIALTRYLLTVETGIEVYYGDASVTGRT